MSFSEVDRLLLQRCIDGQTRSWENFVDRFLGLVVHVANHTASARNIRLDHATRDDLVAEVFLTLIRDDFATLRRFRRNCSLATYLTVIARRVIARRLTRPGGYSVSPGGHAASHGAGQAGPTPSGASDGIGSAEDPWFQQMADQEQLDALLQRLDPQEANVVRMYHLQGKSYREISQAVGLSENSIGPMLSRAKAKMRNGHAT